LSVAILFFGAVGAIAVWWLSQQRLTAKPWLEEGPIGDVRSADASSLLPKIGLGIFLAVVGSLFSLFILAYPYSCGCTSMSCRPQQQA
jgi:cytochrome c oxidase subunit III